MAPRSGSSGLAVKLDRGCRLTSHDLPNSNLRPTDDEVERRIALTLARYLDGAPYDEQAAFEGIRQELGEWLGLLIHRHLADEPTWSAWWSIDDATPGIVEPIDATTVNVAGVAGLLADGSAGDRQPFSATLSLASSQNALVSYVIRFGDKAVGLGPNPMADRVRSQWPEVANWVFEWERPAPRRRVTLPGH
jgi:hypothetical protein